MHLLESGTQHIDVLADSVEMTNFTVYSIKLHHVKTPKYVETDHGNI